MLNNITLSRYQDTNSFLHKLNPLQKLISLILFIILSIITNNLYLHLNYLLIIILLIVISKVSFKEYLYSLRTMLYLILGIFLINILLKVELEDNIISLLKIIETILASTLITLTTKENDTINALIYLLYPLKIFKINIYVLAGIFSMTLKFIPCIIDSINKIILTLKARGVNFKKNRILILKTIIIPTFNLTLKRADDLALSMEVRQYNINKKITKLKKWKLIDIIIVIILIIQIIEVTICDI